jgi:hypothetical protein
MLRATISTVSLLLLVGSGAAVFAQSKQAAATTSLGTVRLPRAVMADGKTLAAGAYTVRLTTESPTPGTGQSPEGERWVEFLQGNVVKGREVASVVSDADIAQVADGARPPRGGAKVEVLKGDEFVRVWINRGGANYLIHMPPVKA